MTDVNKIAFFKHKVVQAIVFSAEEVYKNENDEVPIVIMSAKYRKSVYNRLVAIYKTISLLQFIRVLIAEEHTFANCRKASNGELLNVNYVYSGLCDCERSILFYDMSGRLLDKESIKTINGTIKLATATLTPGIYIIQMEESGHKLQTARVSIVH